MAYLVKYAVNNVGNHKHSRTDPTKNSQNQNQVILLLRQHQEAKYSSVSDLNEGKHQEEMQVGSLAQHPGVVGHCEVGCNHVQGPTPQTVSGPNL